MSDPTKPRTFQIQRTINKQVDFVVTCMSWIIIVGAIIIAIVSLVRTL